MEPTTITYPADVRTALFIPFAKLDPAKRMVYGFASTDAKDSQGEIVEASAMRDALVSYMDFPVVKEMHRMETAVGVTKSAESMAKDDHDGVYVGVKVVDDSAWQKVVEGVYRGFSIGGKVKAKAGDRITKLELREISLVDRPANPDALFDVVKIADAPAPVVAPDPVAVPAPSATNIPEVTRTMLKSDAIATLTKNIYAAHRALEAMGDLASARDSVQYDESSGSDAYAGMTDSINGAMTELAGVLKELLAAAIAALIPAEGNGAGGDVMAMDKAVAEKMQGARAVMADALSKIDGLLKVEAPAPVATPAVDPIVTPAPAVDPAPAVEPVVAKVDDPNLAKIAGLEATVADLTAKVEAMGKIAAPAKTVRLPDDLVARANGLAKKAEGEKDVRTLIKMANAGLLDPS
jgi:HK97 family phage prohead protease